MRLKTAILRAPSPGAARRAAALAAALVALHACPAAAATAFRSGSTAQNSVFGGTTLTIKVPTGTSLGDVLVAFVTSASTTAPTAPSGWTQVSAASTTFTGGSLTVYTHLAGASEPASYSWSLGSFVQASGAIGSYTGVDNATPVQVSSSANGNSRSASAPSVATTANNTTVLVGLGYVNGSAETVTAPSGTTQEGAVQNSGGSVVGTNYGDFVQATAGTIPTQTYQLTSKSAYGTSTVALNDAPAILSFQTAPQLPALPGLTLNGSAQTDSATMANFVVGDLTGSGAGWNVTVIGDGSAGKSAVFKQYCPNTTCGTDSGPGYVSGGQTLTANSLTLTSTGASFTGGSGTAPTLQCAAGCAVDSSTQTKVASAAAGAGAGYWSTTGFAASSVSTSVPTTTRTLQTGEVYRVNVIWTLGSGP
jgi:hypothetical protein